MEICAHSSFAADSQILAAHSRLPHERWFSCTWGEASPRAGRPKNKPNSTQSRSKVNTKGVVSSVWPTRGEMSRWCGKVLRSSDRDLCHKRLLHIKSWHSWEVTWHFQVTWQSFIVNIRELSQTSIAKKGNCLSWRSTPFAQQTCSKRLSCTNAWRTTLSGRLISLQFSWKRTGSYRGQDTASRFCPIFALPAALHLSNKRRRKSPFGQTWPTARVFGGLLLFWLQANVHMIDMEIDISHQLSLFTRELAVSSFEPISASRRCWSFLWEHQSSPRSIRLPRFSHQSLFHWHAELHSAPPRSQCVHSQKGNFFKRLTKSNSRVCDTHCHGEEPTRKASPSTRQSATPQKLGTGRNGRRHTSGTVISEQTSVHQALLCWEESILFSFVFCPFWEYARTCVCHSVKVSDFRMGNSPQKGTGCWTADHILQCKISSPVQKMEKTFCIKICRWQTLEFWPSRIYILRMTQVWLDKTRTTRTQRTCSILSLAMTSLMPNLMWMYGSRKQLLHSTDTFPFPSSVCQGLNSFAHRCDIQKINWLGPRLDVASS